MTQLDLPQISLSRYVDLLKRRRWQVIPVSLIGLLIGGIVAFFIPRYYVANASIAYQQPPGEAPTDPEDPFGAIIDSAKLTIPLAIPQTVQELGWPEGLTDDPFELSQNCKGIGERLTIYEFGDSKGQPFALIRVSYKDRDGLRAAAFLNKLVATWIAQRQGQLMTDAERGLAAANAEHKQHSDAYNTFLQERQHLQQTYRIEPSVELALQREKHSQRVDAQAAAAAALAEQRAQILRLAVQIEHERDVLRGIPVKVKIDPELLFAAAAQTPAGAGLVLEIMYHKLAVESFRPGQPRRLYHTRNIEYLTGRLEELAKGPEVDADGMIPNPAREAQRKLVAKLELDLKLAEADIEERKAQVVDEGARLQRQSEGYRLYERASQRLQEARQAASVASRKIGFAREVVSKLTNEPSVRPEARANVPPAPTEPNLLLVALLGCVIGLFAATALVLLLDVVQGSFKTVEDVEQGLTVPVLGGVSYLETVAQRRESVRSRRRTTLVAAAFLTLVGGVVLLYYFDPTRLPPFVRDMLAIVLGTA